MRVGQTDILFKESSLTFDDYYFVADPHVIDMLSKTGPVPYDTEGRTSALLFADVSLDDDFDAQNGRSMGISANKLKEALRKFLDRQTGFMTGANARHDTFTHSEKGINVSIEVRAVPPHEYFSWCVDAPSIVSMPAVFRYGNLDRDNAYRVVLMDYERKFWDIHTNLVNAFNRKFLMHHLDHSREDNVQ